MTKKVWIVLGIMIFMGLPGMMYAADSAVTAEPEMLSLDHCLELASDNSQTIKAAEKKVEIAEAAITEARSAYWPKLDYSIFADKAQEAIYPYDAVVYPGASTDYSGATISLTQDLYSGGKSANELQLAKIQLDMARENERQVKQQLTFQVKQAFYQVWLVERVLKVVESSLDNMEQHVVRTENLYKIGTVSKYELLRARVQRDSLKPQLISAQNDLKMARLNLAILIGLVKDRQYSVAFNSDQLKIPAQSQLIMDKILESAYQNRPEIRQVKQTETLGQYQEKLAEAGYQPKISLIGQYEAGSLDYNPSHWNDGKLWILSLNITDNIFDGFSTPAKVKGAQKNVDLTKIQETGLRDQIRLDVEQAAQNIQESLEVINANQSNIDMAKESLEETQERFGEGLATTMDVMDSELALDQALNGYYKGIALYLTAQAKLDLVTGRD
jgi:outer membrane protein